MIVKFNNVVTSLIARKTFLRVCLMVKTELTMAILIRSVFRFWRFTHHKSLKAVISTIKLLDKGCGRGICFRVIGLSTGCSVFHHQYLYYFFISRIIKISKEFINYFQFNLKKSIRR